MKSGAVAPLFMGPSRECGVDWAERKDASNAERVKRYCGKECERAVGPVCLEEQQGKGRRGTATVFADRQEQEGTGARNEFLPS